MGFLFICYADDFLKALTTLRHGCHVMCTSVAPPFKLGSLEPYLKSSDSDFKLDKQISAVVQNSFFQFRQSDKLKPVLTWQGFSGLLQYLLCLD